MNADNTILAKNAQLNWDRVRNGTAITKVEVIDISIPDSDDHELPASSGACNADWLLGNAWSTPEGQYARWVNSGFATPEFHIAALEEIAKIEGCLWARRMADVHRQILEQ